MDLIETFHAENTLNDMKDDTSWNINMEHAVKSRFHSYKKNYSAEYDSCFLNLDEVIKDLNDGITIEEIVRDKNYLRNEKAGIYRIGQTGIRNAKETRLYFGLYSTAKEIIILTIGDKSTQQPDLNQSRKTFKPIFMEK